MKFSAIPMSYEVIISQYRMWSSVDVANAMVMHQNASKVLPGVERKDSNVNVNITQMGKIVKSVCPFIMILHGEELQDTLQTLALVSSSSFSSL